MLLLLHEKLCCILVIPRRVAIRSGLCLRLRLGCSNLEVVRKAWTVRGHRLVF